MSDTIEDIDDDPQSASGSVNLDFSATSTAFDYL